MLNERSLKNLEGVHADLRAVVLRAAEFSPIAFAVTEGLRTYERQKKLVAQGASKTMNSRHLTGHAVDFVALIDPNGDGVFELCWKWHLYQTLNGVMLQATRDIIGKSEKIEWGGNWKGFQDGCHWQLAWDFYPVENRPINA